MLNFTKKLLDLIYPDKKRCLNCGKEIFFPEVEGLCYECLEELCYTSRFCSVCGRELDLDQRLSSRKYKCSFCSDPKNEFEFEKARSLFVYEDFGREMLFHYKYFDKKELAFPFGELLYIYYTQYFAENDIDFIIPIPLYEKRKEERGYNQAGLLAEVLAEKTGIPARTHLLLRSKKTPPLYDLNREKRLALLQKVFSVERGEELKGKKVLLVDDIFTTGTTTNEAALTLKKEAEVEFVYVLTLATARVEIGTSL